MADQLIYDGSLDFLGGQDASKVPGKIAQNAYAAGVNITISNGALRPRDAFHKIELILPEGGIELPNLETRDYADIFVSGKYQARIPYSIGQEKYAVIVISGVIFLFNQRTKVVNVVEIEGEQKLNELASRINWTQAGRFIVLYDYPAYPVIIDGFEARRANPEDNEIPISVLGTYNQNRLFIANAGNEFTAGDAVGNTATPDAPITFNEILQPASTFFGQIFQLTTEYNNEPITAMTFLQATDSSTGIGPLLIATNRAIYSYLTQQSRDDWQGGQFGSNLTYNVGIAGPRAYVNTLSDLFFLSSDGQVRSLSMSRDEQRKWARVPMSREVENWLKYWDKKLVSFAVLEYFNNKIYVTANPFKTSALTTAGLKTTDVAHGGLVVLGLENISSLGEAGRPAWEGLWTGVRPMDMWVNDERCFIISKDGGFQNAIYELIPGTTVDTSGSKVRRVKSTVYTREYDFESSFQNKELHSIDVALSDIAGEFSLDIEYKPANSSKFLEFTEFNHEAPVCITTIPTDAEVNGLASHNFNAINLGAPRSDGCDPITNQFYRWFKKLQLRLKVEADRWELEEFRLKAVIRPQSETEAVCKPYPVVKLPKECNTDWDIGEFGVCQTQKQP